MTEQKLVSICMLTYMHEAYIEDCLESFLLQTYTNLELIMFDDCSTDNTYKIIKRYEKKLKQKFVRVSLYRANKNQGNISKNVNYLISKANGEYIKMISGDDILLPNGIEKLVAYMESNKEINVLYGGVYLVSDDFSLTKRGKIVPVNNTRKKISFESMLKNNELIALGELIKKNCFEKYGLFDENVKFEDYEFALRLLVNGEKIVQIPDKVAYYRKCENSISNFESKKYKKRNIKYIIYGDIKILYKYIKYAKKDKKIEIINSVYRKFCTIIVKGRTYSILPYVLFNYLKILIMK